MCAGALVNARVARLVYGCADPKAGAVDTLFTHRPRRAPQPPLRGTRGLVLADECAAALRAFFAPRRKPRSVEPTQSELATTPIEPAKGDHRSEELA